MVSFISDKTQTSLVDSTIFEDLYFSLIRIIGLIRLS